MEESTVAAEAWTNLWDIHDKYKKEGLSNPVLHSGDYDDGPYYEDYDRSAEDPACTG